eukprot:GHVU01202157.1.p1 GENE.GHVU01202157.1~~GHVU01202157.1.p1  ORF type:complete len:169 (-),score=26.50 GHVU01202157.1:839-1345(-)
MVITEIRQLFDSFSFNDWIIFTVLLVALHMFLALLKRAALACLSLSEPGRGGVSEAAISAAYSAGRGLRRQPCKLVLVVRADLNMQKGKIAAQAGHATLGAFRTAVRQKNKWLKSWESEGEMKVVVKADEAEFDSIHSDAKKHKLPSFVVHDAVSCESVSQSGSVSAH